MLLRSPGLACISDDISCASMDCWKLNYRNHWEKSAIHERSITKLVLIKEDKDYNNISKSLQTSYERNDLVLSTTLIPLTREIPELLNTNYAACVKGHIHRAHRILEPSVHHSTSACCFKRAEWITILSIQQPSCWSSFISCGVCMKWVARSQE